MADSSPMAPVKANAKRQKDDKDFHKYRLTDVAFHAKHYPDPLVSRPSPDPALKSPADVTPEMTKRWLDMIRDAATNTDSK